MIRVAQFELERFFARWESRVRYHLGSSDTEPVRTAELLALAEPETRELWDNLALGYTETSGHPTLRAEIATMYPGLSRDDILVTSGPTEAIFLVAHALLGPSDHAVVVWPAYQALYESPRSAKASVTLVPLSAESKWTLDVDALRRAMKPLTRLLIINFPHNPTGSMIDRATLAAIVDCARTARAWLLSDEMFRFLEYDEADRLPPMAAEYEKGISLAGMSKVFGMGGARIGWLATRDRAALGAIAKLKDYTSICNSAPSEVLSLIALRARETIIARRRAALLTNLLQLDRFFAEHDDVFAWIPPRAGTVAFPALRAGNVDEFAEGLARYAGVLVVPGSAFQVYDNRFRIGLGRSVVPDALPALSQFVRDSRAIAVKEDTNG